MRRRGEVEQTLVHRFDERQEGRYLRDLNLRGVCKPGVISIVDKKTVDSVDDRVPPRVPGAVQSIGELERAHHLVAVDETLPDLLVQR